MKAVLNVIEVGIVAVACASLLSACDGRGITPFKSKQFTPEELALHKVQRDGGQAALDTGGDPSAPTPSQLIGAGGAQNQPAGTNGPVGASNLATVGPASAPQQLVNSGNAQAKVYLEFGTLMDLVEKYLRPKDPSAAIAAVKGIDITVDPGQNSRLLTIDARVSLGGQEQNLYVAQAPIGPTDQNGKVEPLPITIGSIDNSSAPVPAEKSKVIGYGFCREQDCKTIHVILDFELAKGGAVVVFALQVNDSSKTYEIVESSLGDQRKRFCEATGSKCDDAQPSAADQAPAAGGVTDVPKSQESQAAPVDLNSPPTVSQLQTLNSAKKPNTLAQLVLVDAKTAPGNDELAASLSKSANRGGEGSSSIMFNKNAPTVEATNK